MKRIALILFFPFFAVLTGCASTKSITIVDSGGHPIGNCYVYVKQENMLYPNSSDLFIADQSGTVTVSYNGLVHFYVGKEGFFVSSFWLVGEANIRVVLYSLQEKISTQKIMKLTIQPKEEFYIKNGTQEIKKWIKYVTSTPIVDGSQQLLDNN